LEKAPLSSDTYMFFKHNHEAPSFMMDSDATYIVASYKIHNFDDGTHAHVVSARVISDLFMCLHGYIDATTEAKNFFCDSVRYMDYYLEFENLIIDKLGENSGSISKTESLKTITDWVIFEKCRKICYNHNDNWFKEKLKWKKKLKNMLKNQKSL